MNTSKNEMNAESEEKKKFFRDFFSHNFAQFAIGLQATAYAGLYFFFFETEILLPIFYIILANIIYFIWIAINGPVLGFITDRPNRLTKKWGKRFPWMVFSLPLLFITYIFLFSPPNVDVTTMEGTFIIFLWLVIILCISDTFYSIFRLNIDGMYADKFRSDKNRRKAAGYGTVLAMVGSFLGGILPPMLYNFGDKKSYSQMALIICILGLMSWIISIPGLREDEIMIQRYLQSYQENDKTSFFNTIKAALKQKNFVVFIIISFIYFLFVILISLSLPYFTKYVLGMEADIQILFFVGHFLGLILSIPLWMKFTDKYGIIKTFVFGVILTIFFLIPGMWISDPLSTFIIFILVGFARGSINVVIMPIFSEVMDEIAVNTGKRQEGIYMGIRTIFTRITIIVGIVIVATIHILTGFLPNASLGRNTQNPLAIFGIRIHLVLIPLICLILGVIIFWKYYDIKGEKRETIKTQLKKMGI